MKPVPRIVPAGQEGTVVWITGLSGAGKSTIARTLHETLRKKRPAVLIDGDDFRAVFGDGVGHTPQDRLLNAKRICRFCAYLSGQGLDVVCATMSLFHECHAWNRANIAKYFEVLVDVPLEVLHRRDARGLYSRASSGQVADVVGVHLSYELPENPHMTVDNTQTRDDFSAIAREIIDAAGLAR